jgi:hypothetical protein
MMMSKISRIIAPVILLLSGPALAQPDARRGLSLARENCEQCHAIDNTSESWFTWFRELTPWGWSVGLDVGRPTAAELKPAAPHPPPPSSLSGQAAPGHWALRSTIGSATGLAVRDNRFEKAE